MENKKLTAVEWLRENLHLAKDPFTQALELEKEQIIEAHAEGQFFIVGVIEESFSGKIDLTKTKLEIEKHRSGKDNDETAEQYYQNTYGNKER